METAPYVQRTQVVERRIGDSVLVVVPHSGDVLLLDPTAALVWAGLERATDLGRLERLVAEVFPAVERQVRIDVVDSVVTALESDGLVERI